MKKPTIKCAILTAIIISLTACGNSMSNDKPNNTPENASKIEYSYIPEYTELGGGEFTSFQDIQFEVDTFEEKICSDKDIGVVVAEYGTVITDTLYG